MHLIEIAQAVSTGGAAVAVIITVRLFLRALRERDDAHEGERSAIYEMIHEERTAWRDERSQFLALVATHLQKQSEGFTQVLARLNGLQPANRREGTPGPETADERG